MMGKGRRKSQNSSRSRGTSIDRPRRRQGSITSLESSTDQLLEDNDSEMYSGATSEVIPSSITSFHYAHSFRNMRHRQSSTLSREETSLLAPNEQLELGSVKTNSSGDSYETQPNFKFFSTDEIESAPGGSTLENPDDPIDYNTEWDYNIARFDNDPEQESLGPRDRESDGDHSTGDGDYGSMDSHFDRHRRRGSNSSNHSSSSESENSLPDNMGDDFYKSYPSIIIYQRYYLAEEDLVIGIAGYSNSLPKKILYYIICFATLGLGYLILRWIPKYRINLMGNKCPLGQADWCVIENEHGELTIVNIMKKKFNERLSNVLTIAEEDLESEYKDSDPIIPFMHRFTYRYLNFFYNPVEDIFKTNSNWYDSHWIKSKSTKDGVSQSKYEQRLDIFGTNNIDIEEKSALQLFTEEVLHPFYIFQIFSIILWMADDYYYYATCIFFISIISIANTLVETKFTMKRLQDISKFTCEVRAWRNEFWKQIDSIELVPGDIFEVDPSLTIIPCDAILVNGECVVNESMLTGESVPVSKTSATQESLQFLPDNFTSPVLAKSFLYNGTKLLKSRTSNDEPVIARAVRTGFNSTKGSLIRSMLFPKPSGFKFYRDSFKYIGFMTVIAFVGFIYSTYNFIKLGISRKVMVLRALDIITIVVPPALPATLTIGTTFAINRLKKLQIFCIAPTRINISGKLDAICFDKTGTLTEDGLDVLGVHLVKNAPGRKELVFSDLDISLDGYDRETPTHEKYDIALQEHLLGGMACCHSLKLIDGSLLGDPLDFKMFDFTNWSYEEHERGFRVAQKGGAKKGYTVTKEYEFVSNLRRMSVVASEDTSGKQYIFTKGAPEIMSNICNRDTIPSNYEELLYDYTHRGYRVIACAYKDNADEDSREIVESNLTFTGFIIFENKLKTSTKPTLKALEDAQIRRIMCTGDNILTAISVARESGLINSSIQDIFVPSLEETPVGLQVAWHHYADPNRMLSSSTLEPLDPLQTSDFKLAITGDLFRYILVEVKDSNITQKILTKCDVFARMSPDEKHELVEQLQRLDYTVGFCGDGANDCGALKAADVGISLSEAEASVAAPVTSRVFEISCVLDVIREGRSSLVTSFACFKYMSLYSAIQFVTVTILYQRGTNLGDFQFLYIDLFLILPLAIFMSWSKPAVKIIAKRPTGNLVSPKILIPMIGHIFVILSFQIIVWKLVQAQSWYIRPIAGGDDVVESSDNTALFLFSTFQYILIALVLTKGPPYREPVQKNIPFAINIAISTVLSIGMLTINSESSLGHLLQLTSLSALFDLIVVLLAVLNLVIMKLGEDYFFVKLTQLYKRLCIRRWRSKKAFKNILRGHPNV